jgi:hypothetical protein
MDSMLFLCCLAALATLGSFAEACPNSGNTLVALSGSITDGFGYYSSNTDCVWIIAPSGASSATITFSQFDLEDENDYLTISACDTVSCSNPTTLARFTGHSIPSNIAVGKVTRVRFTSDGSSSYAGFTLSYSASSSLPLSSASSCSVGQYYSSTYSRCQSCSNKPSNAYYTSNGGSSSDGCSWSCSSGYMKTNGYCSFESGYEGSYERSDEEVGALALSSKSKIITGVLGTFWLLTIIVVLIIMRARPLDASADPPSVVCLKGYHARLSCLIAAAALALTTLVLTLVFDSDSQLCNIGHRLRLMLAALGIHVIGGITLYSLSGCGCRLCLCFYCNCCDRTCQATTAIGFSLFFWFIGLFAYAVLVFALLLLSFQMERLEDADLQGLCRLTVFLPLGVGPACGLCSAAAMLLQGHFITLVPEAVAAHSRRSAPPGGSDTELAVSAGNAGLGAKEPATLPNVRTDSAAAAIGLPAGTNTMV